jgi:hypothetical protein
LLSFSFTSYLADARVTSAGVDAGFGNLGRVAVEFARTGEPRTLRPPRGCTGRPQVEWHGEFTGTVRFSGSPGFPAFADRSFSSKGTMTRVPAWHCRGQGREPELPGPENDDGIELTAISCDGRGLIVRSERPYYDVFPHGRDPLSISTYAIERRGPVLVEQSLTALAKPKTFVFDEALTTATLGPPPPFHGTASLAPGASGPEWSGSLSVSLPGKRVRLTGPDFRTHLDSFKIGPPGSFSVVAVRACLSEV